MKTVQHHPEVGIPILVVNKGFESSSVFFAGIDYCQQCASEQGSAAYLQISKPILSDTIIQNDCLIIPNFSDDLRSLYAMPSLKSSE